MYTVHYNTCKSNSFGFDSTPGLQTVFYTFELKFNIMLEFVWPPVHVQPPLHQ